MGVLGERSEVSGGDDEGRVGNARCKKEKE